MHLLLRATDWFPIIITSLTQQRDIDNLRIESIDNLRYALAVYEQMFGPGGVGAQAGFLPVLVNDPHHATTAERTTRRNQLFNDQDVPPAAAGPYHVPIPTLAPHQQIELNQIPHINVSI